MNKKLLTGGLWLICGLGYTQANTSISASETIIWACESNKSHQTSAGVAWDESFIFQLGVFDGSFTPTAANRAQWAQNWRLAQAARYIPDGRYTSAAAIRVFSNSYCFSSNAAPFTVGKQAYIWGVGGRQGTEWVLMGNAAWTWPAIQSPPLPFGVEWVANGSVTFVGGAGQSVTSGSPYFYRSTEVTDSAAHALPWEAWRALHFPEAAELSNTALSGPNADPDSDGLKNIDEYAQMTWPRLAFSGRAWPSEALTTLVSGSPHLTLRLRFDPRSRLSFSAQRSTNLITWDSAAAATVQIENTSGRYTVREANTTGGPQRFLRASSTPQP
jgi:hypothetical protein